MLEFIGVILEIALFLAIVFFGTILFIGILMASLILGAIFGVVRGFFFMTQSLITDVLGIGNL